MIINLKTKIARQSSCLSFSVPGTYVQYTIIINFVYGSQNKGACQKIEDFVVAFASEMPLFFFSSWYVHLSALLNYFRCG